MMSMNSQVYEVEAQIEATHWWFRARRELVARFLSGLALTDRAIILDVGSSTGTNLRLLKEMGFRKFQGVDTSPEAIEWCRQKGLGLVSRADAQDLPFPEQSFDVVLATDVLEHLDDDQKGMNEFFRVLRPGGWALVTVPTFAALWGRQDEVSHHRRRYRLSALMRMARASGFEIQEKFYFNYLLFVPIWVARQFLKRLPSTIESENQLNTPWLNQALYQVFSWDTRVAPLLKSPVGVSAFLLLRRPKTN